MSKAICAKGLYSNIIEVSNNIQTNLDEVDILTNDRISKITNENEPLFIYNYKNNLKITVDEFVKFVRYFNLINSKLDRSISNEYQLVFFGDKESVHADIKSHQTDNANLENTRICLLEKDECVLRNVNDYLKCGNYKEEIDYINEIIGNDNSLYNRENNGINISLGIHELVLLKKEIIPYLKEVGYGNNIFGQMMIFNAYSRNTFSGGPKTYRFEERTKVYESYENYRNKPKPDPIPINVVYLDEDMSSMSGYTSKEGSLDFPKLSSLFVAQFFLSNHSKINKQDEDELQIKKI